MKVKYTISYEPLVEKDLKESITYYNSRQKGLGSRFHSEYLFFIEAIKKNPLIFQTRYNDIHVAPLKSFPFLIFYIVIKNEIVILSVLLMAKDSERWPGK